MLRLSVAVHTRHRVQPNLSLCQCSYYVAAQSRPELGQFFFAYNVNISNEGSKIVMLERRHWVITDGNGKVDHVR